MAGSKNVLSDETVAQLMEMICNMQQSERQQIVDAGLKCCLMLNPHLLDLLDDCALLLTATRLGPDHEIMRDVLKGREDEFNPESVSSYILGVERAVAAQVCHEIEMPYDKDEGFDEESIVHTVNALDRIIIEMAADCYKHFTGRKE